MTFRKPCGSFFVLLFIKNVVLVPGKKDRVLRMATGHMRIHRLAATISGLLVKAARRDDRQLNYLN